MAGTIKMLCIRMNILSHRNNIELFLPCNMAAMQNLYCQANLTKLDVGGGVGVYLRWTSLPSRGGSNGSSFASYRNVSFLYMWILYIGRYT